MRRRRGAAPGGNGGTQAPAAPGPASLERGVAAASPSAVASGSDILEKVSDDVATDADADRRAEQRRRRVTLAGHRGDAALARRGLGDPDPGVQAAALGALARLGRLTAADVASRAGRRPARAAAPRRRGGAGRPRPRLALDAARAP